MSIISKLSSIEREYYGTKFQLALKAIQRGWTQGQGARTADGESTSPLHPSAVKFCAYGAICASFADKKTEHISNMNRHKVKIMMDVIRERPEMTDSFVSEWNDAPERKKKDVVQLFKNVIKDLE